MPDHAEHLQRLLRERILIIDGEISILEMLRVALTRAGYQVREATSGPVGVQMYRDRPADLVLCDLHMAGQSAELRRSPAVQAAYLGGAVATAT